MSFPQDKRNAESEEQIRAEEHVERYSGRSVVIAFILLAIFLYLIRIILLPFAVAGVVAYILSPLVNLLTVRTRLPRTAVAAALFLAVLGLAILLAVLIFPALVSEATRLTTDLKGSVTNTIKGALGGDSIQIFGMRLNAAELGAQAEATARDWLGQMKNIVYMATWSFSVAFGAFLTLVIFFYFMVNGPSIAEGLLDLAPPKQRPFVRLIWSRVDPVLKRYFIGVGIVVLYASCAAYIGLHFFLNLQHAVLLALLTGVLEIIPVVGPLLSAVIAGLIAIQSATSVWNIVEYIIYASALRLSIDQLFGPVVLGRAARIPAVLVIFCFLAGGILYGILGVVLAIPVALTIRIVLNVVYDEPNDREAV